MAVESTGTESEGIMQVILKVSSPEIYDGVDYALIDVDPVFLALQNLRLSQRTSVSFTTKGGMLYPQIKALLPSNLRRLPM